MDNKHRGQLAGQKSSSQDQQTQQNQSGRKGQNKKRQGQMGQSDDRSKDRDQHRKQPGAQTPQTNS